MPPKPSNKIAYQDRYPHYPPDAQERLMAMADQGQKKSVYSSPVDLQEVEAILDLEKDSEEEVMIVGRRQSSVMSKFEPNAQLKQSGFRCDPPKQSPKSLFGQRVPQGNPAYDQHINQQFNFLNEGILPSSKPTSVPNQ